MTTFLWILWTNAIQAIITLVLVAYYRYYKPNVLDPVAQEHGPQAVNWKDFILANIASCIHPDQCYYCNNLISMFEEMFKDKMPKKVYEDWLEIMNNRIDTKFAMLSAEHDLQIDDFINQ